MKEIEDYIVLSRNDLSSLSIQVKEKSQRGYVLVGGISSPIKNGAYLYYLQAMVKYKEKDLWVFLG
jgi:hypothetical protein